MPFYKIETVEEEVRNYTYYVRASSEEEAERKVREGEIDPEDRSEWIAGEIEKLEVTEIEDEDI